MERRLGGCRLSCRGEGGSGRSVPGDCGDGARRRRALGQGPRAADEPCFPRARLCHWRLLRVLRGSLGGPADPAVGGRALPGGARAGRRRLVAAAPEGYCGVRQISCAICGIADEVVVYRSTIPPRAAGASLDPYAAHYQINRCRRCDLVYSSPILDEACVAALYTNSAHGSVAAGEERNAQRTMELYYELVRPHLSARRRVLDIGCDVGFLLKVARGDGFAELHGIEPNPVARAEAAKLPGAVVYDRFYETQDFPDAYFDLVTLVHVVDHLVDPGRVLARARRHLRPGGVILAVVHDVRSPLARLLGERFPPYNLYHHYFFSKVTL